MTSVRDRYQSYEVRIGGDTGTTSVVIGRVIRTSRESRARIFIRLIERERLEFQLCSLLSPLALIA